MLYTNLSVQSTLLEGYNSDGSIGYSLSVTSTYRSLISVYVGIGAIGATTATQPMSRMPTGGLQDLRQR